MSRILSILLLLCFVFAQCTNAQITTNKMKEETNKMEIAVFGAGCFWCVEAAFLDLKGVDSVKSGYTGGHIINPTYKDVCTGNTGHAEVVYVEFDPTVINYQTLLAVFFTVHDPTQLNRQGNDVGTQYRSEIFHTNSAQKNAATEAIKTLTEQGAFDYPIVTKISELGTFYPAENYHDNYFNQNPNESYCQFVVKPKVDKVKKIFAQYMK